MMDGEEKKLLMRQVLFRALWLNVVQYAYFVPEGMWSKSSFQHRMLGSIDWIGTARAHTTQHTAHSTVEHCCCAAAVSVAVPASCFLVCS